MKFRPLHDRVVVKRVEEDTKTKGGIIIPDTAQEKPMQGEIIAVGPGGRDEAGKLIPIDVKAGDIVLFGKWSGTEVKIDGTEYLIMKESDIMGVLEGKTGRQEGRLIAPARRLNHSRKHQGVTTMAAKEVRFGGEARERMLRGVDILANAVKSHPRPQGPQRRHRQELRRSPHHQGRCDGRQGDRARGQVREHGRPDGARSRLEDQ